MSDLDIEEHASLIAWLRAEGHIAASERPRVETLTGGVSNRTVLVVRESGEGWVLKQALGKLRVQVDWFSPPERVHREADGLRWLERLAPTGTTTPLIFENFTHHLIAMAAVPQPHQNWKSMLLTGDVRLDHVEQFARLLGTIHRVSHERLSELRTVFSDRGYFESLRLEPYYGYTLTQVPAAAGFLTDLIAETRSHADTLVHGDYSPKNVLVQLDTDRLVLLDHEVIHIGDPGFDLGFSLTHLLSKSHHVADRRPDFAVAAARYWQVYAATAGGADWTVDLEARAARHTLGCLLARVWGRSPLEYLGAAERDRQERAVVQLMADPPATVATLADRFILELGR